MISVSYLYGSSILVDFSYPGCALDHVRASKIKLKNVNKKRMATARRLIFLEFLKASIADLITLFSSLQISEGGGDRVCAHDRTLKAGTGIDIPTHKFYSRSPKQQMNTFHKQLSF
jgi:hypothetical protein